jgi:hypothetical protein
MSHTYGTNQRPFGCLPQDERVRAVEDGPFRRYFVLNSSTRFTLAWLDTVRTKECQTPASGSGLCREQHNWTA